MPSTRKTAKTKKPEKTIFLVIQQGGSSREFYLHTFDTRRQANNYRRSCDRAAYCTSRAIEIPLSLEKHLDLVQNVVYLAAKMV